MTAPTRSILVISPDRSVTDAITASVAGLPNLRIMAETNQLSAMNGYASKFVRGHDVVVFQTDPGNPEEMAAIAALAANRSGGAVFVALADSSISLAQVRALTDAGVDEVLPIPVGGDDLGARLARIGHTAVPGRMNSGAASAAGRVIALAQSRGGIGATTIAVNLADQLTGVRRFLHRSRPRRRVALVDLDIQFGTVGTMLDLPEQDTLLQLALDGTIPDATFLEQSMTTLPSGLSVLAAPARFAPLEALRADQVAAILDALRQTHDYIVVDLPRALVGWIEPVLNRADTVIVVTDVAVPSIRHCRRLIDFYTNDHITLPVQVIVNHQARPLFRSAAQREAANALDRKIGHWLPHDPRPARAAIDHGKPLSAVAARAPLTRAIARLAASVQTAFPAAHHVNPPK